MSDFPRVATVLGVLALSSVSYAADGASAAPESWSGSYQCGAIPSSPGKFPPYTIKFSMAMEAGRVTVLYESPRSRQTLEGALSADGTVKLSGPGFNKGSEDRTWQLQFDARVAQGTLQGTGVLINVDGKKVRECSIMATRQATPGAGGVADQATPPSDNAASARAPEETAAIIEKQIREREASGGPQDRGIAWSKVSLAGEYRKIARFADAERLLLEAVRVFEKDRGASPDHAAALGSLASLYQIMGRLNEAERYAQQSVTVYLDRVGPRSTATVAQLRVLAEIFYDQRRYAEALEIAGRAVEIASQHHAGTVTHGNVLSDLGRIAQRSGDHERAEEALRKATQVAAALPKPSPQLSANIQQRLAVTLVARGRFEEAKDLLMQARQHYQRGRLTGGLAFNSLVLGRAALGLNDDARAIEFLEESVRLFTQLRGVEHPDTIATKLPLANAYHAGGRQDAALETLSGAAAALDRYLAQRQTQSPAARAEQEASLRAVLSRYLALIMEYGGRQLPDGTDVTQAAFAVAEQLRNRATQAAIVGMGARAATGDDELAQLVRREQDLRVARGAIEAEIREALGSGADGRGPSQTLIRRRNEIDAQLKELNARIDGRFPKYAQLLHPRPPTLEEVRASLPADVAMLSYLVQTNRTLLWVITREAVSMHVVKVPAEALGKRVGQLRRALDAEITTIEDIKPYDTALGHELYSLLVAPAADAIAAKPHVLVIPHGPLFSLPFAALVTAPAPAPSGAQHFAAYAQVPWLGRSHTVTVAPSALAVATLRQAKRTPAERPFIGFGDPTFKVAAVPTGKTLQRGLRDTRDLEKLTPLPETNEELRQIARALHAPESEVYVGAGATETNVKRADLSRYRVVVFATHGLLAGELDGVNEPALALTPPAKPSAGDDGLLTMSEVLGLKMNADWVVLSACNTASGDGSVHGDGLSGLTQAFFYAGSRALLVTLWPVESKSAQTLTTTLFGGVRDAPRQARAHALAAAQRAMMSGKAGAPEYGHPFFWAPFILVGDGGAS